MFTLSRLEDVPALARGAYLAIGNFDGVHRGHARLIGRLRALADAAGVPAVAVTFDPHPVALLRPEAAPVPLAWTARNIELLEQAGAAEVGVFRTGPWLLELTAREFFDRVIAGRFAAIGMVEGPNFGFGRARGGDTRQLADWCADAGIALEVIPPTEIDGQLVSSSRIRADLAEGRVSEAAALLGRPHRIRGMVTHGAGRGAGLGVPTANLDDIDTIIPAHGVYAALAYIEGEGPPRPAACNVGPNPTFGEQEQKVEAHLIDFRGDLYGRTVHLEFLERLRGTRPFGGLDDLLTQIAVDVERSREIAARAIRGS